LRRALGGFSSGRLSFLPARLTKTCAERGQLDTKKTGKTGLLNMRALLACLHLGQWLHENRPWAGNAVSASIARTCMIALALF